ncbi:hypothetical protein E2C01_038765 [Portunus trituberculatus]|uniref:Uncharacterized protein n=1 Tax=Portunus trituberculatus TaxID=210409 RepID=A0A5B7FF04_PORTR|nr:hypothetical protein [Portunus trituberculatus]
MRSSRAVCGRPSSHQVTVGAGLAPTTIHTSVTPTPADTAPSTPRSLMDMGGTVGEGMLACKQFPYYYSPFILFTYIHIIRPFITF